MKTKDLKWLVGMIPDDAEVIIGGNRFAEVVAVDCDDFVDRLGERAYNLVLTEGWSITKDAELDAMVLRLRQLIEGYRGQDQDLNLAAQCGYQIALDKVEEGLAK